MKKHNTNKLIALLLLLLVSMSFTKAQSILRISQDGISGLPDTVHYGDTLQNMTVTVINDGPAPVLGQLLEVESITNGGPLSTLGSLLIPTALPLLPGDSLVVPLDMFVVSPQNSNNGSNIVVVWPASPGTQPGDSVEDNYYVDDQVGIWERSEAELALDFYPNPCQNQLRITSELPWDPGYEVTILSLTGEALLKRPLGADKILDLGDVPAGMFLVRVTDADGRSRTEKVLKLKD